MTERKIYPPLPADHFAIGQPCDRCGQKFVLGDRTTIVEKPGGIVDGFNVEAVLVHADCVREHKESRY